MSRIDENLEHMNLLVVSIVDGGSGGGGLAPEEPLYSYLCSTLILIL